jgi:hypothetical protein
MAWGKKKFLKSLESCYKIQRKFYISEQLNKETEIKKIHTTQKKTLTYHKQLKHLFKNYNNPHQENNSLITFNNFKG